MGFFVLIQKELFFIIMSVTESWCLFPWLFLISLIRFYIYDYLKKQKKNILKHSNLLCLLGLGDVHQIGITMLSAICDGRRPHPSVCLPFCKINSVFFSLFHQLLTRSSITTRTSERRGKALYVCVHVCVFGYWMSVCVCVCLSSLLPWRMMMTIPPVTWWTGAPHSWK